MKHYRYATKHDNGMLSDIYSNYIPYQGGLVCNKNEMVYSVVFEECKKDKYDMVAWRDAGENKIDFIFKNIKLLNVCFPYGVNNPGL